MAPEPLGAKVVAHEVGLPEYVSTAASEASRVECWFTIGEQRRGGEVERLVTG
jgi:hypothetical protein